MDNTVSAFSQADRNQKLSYTGFLIHGIFLALAVTFTEINTVLPALIIRVGGSEIHIGILTTIMIGLPLVSQLLFSSFLQSRPRKKPFLLGGIYSRMTAFYLIGFLLFSADSFSTSVMLVLIYSGLVLFTISGAFAGITYVSLIGSTIPETLRKRFFLNKQLFWSIGVFISGLLTRYIISFENGIFRYGLLFVMAASMLALASSGFWLIRETKPAALKPVKREPVFSSMKKVLKQDSTFRNYIFAANLLSASIVMIPFYMKIFISSFNFDGEFVGIIVLLQVGGMVASNLIWPRIVKPLGFKGLLRVQSVLGFSMPLATVLALSLGADYRIVYFIPPVLGAMAGAHKMSAEAVLVQISADHSRALYSGIFGALNLASAFFPLVIAVAIPAAGWKVVFTAAAFLPLLGMLPISKMVCPVDIQKAKLSMAATGTG